MVIPTNTKVCKYCNNIDLVSNFVKGTDTCKSCKKKQNKAYREKNKLKAPVTVQRCSLCHITKPSSAFNISNCSPTGLQYTCRTCQSKDKKSYTVNSKVNSEKYRAAIIQATPPWLSDADRKLIETWKQIARELSGNEAPLYEVDHIEAIQAKDRCGLNVPWNLQIITKSENASKGNQSGLINGVLE